MDHPYRGSTPPQRRLLPKPGFIMSNPALGAGPRRKLPAPPPKPTTLAFRSTSLDRPSPPSSSPQRGTVRYFHSNHIFLCCAFMVLIFSALGNELSICITISNGDDYGTSNCQSSGIPSHYELSQGMKWILWWYNYWFPLDLLTYFF